MPKVKRVNKSKPEITQDITKIANANRMREVVRKVVYPFLLELNNTIGHTKVFMQAAASAVESAFTEKQKTLKIRDLIPRLNDVFTSKEPQTEAEYAKYRRLFELLADETLYDFNTMIYSMPRTIEGYYTQEADKHQIIDLDIEKLLG